MKIRRGPKKVVPPHPEIATLINTILATADKDLPSLLSSVVEWQWPRGDLHTWIKVLNKFDGILESVIDEYALKTIQTVEFSPQTKELVMSILRFQKMLLERCTNRKMYASYERLGDLLFCQDLDVVTQTLRLVHRPAQQYSFSSHIAELAPTSVIVKRVLALSHGWGPSREAGYSLSKLASTNEDTSEISPEPADITFQFYRRQTHEETSRPVPAVPESTSGMVTPTAATPSTAGPASAFASTGPSTSSSFQPPATFGHSLSNVGVPSTPANQTNTFQTPARPKPKAVSDLKDALKTPSASPTTQNTSVPGCVTTPEGLTTINLGSVASLLAEGKTPMTVLAEAVETYDVPEVERFELLNVIKIAMGLGNKDVRRNLVEIRCLAIAVYCCLVPENIAQTDLFLYEPDLVAHIAELIRVDAGIPSQIQSAAVPALDAMCRYRHRISEVISAMNASANHGVLMSLFRSMVAKLGEESDDPPFDLVDSLVSMLTFLVSTPSYSNMIVGAGLVPMLVQLVQNNLLSRAPAVTKAINLIDHVIYSNSNGFTLFHNAGGLDALINKIKLLVDQAVEAHNKSMDLSDKDLDNSYGLLPFRRFSALRAVVRSMNRIMQSTGTSEGLRNLIDSSLPKTLKTIIEHRRIFGPSLLSLALGSVATFVHNEPTSLSVLQELKIPEAFYSCVEEDIEASAEVLFSIPNVIGALCLNQAGLDQLTARPEILPKLINTIISERHLKTLQEKENASQLGAYVDELVRHHPTLKDPLRNAVIGVIKKIQELGQEEKTDEETVYHIIPVDKSTETTPRTDPSPPSTAATGSGADVPISATVPDVTTANAPSTSAVVSTSSPSGTPQAASGSLDSPNWGKKEGEPYTDNLVVQFIGSTARFLEGLFNNHTHCKDFIKADGLSLLLDLYAMPCIPYDFAGSQAADSLFALFRAMSEVNPNAVLSALLKPVRTSLDQTAEFWSTLESTSKLSGLTDLPAGPELDKANDTFRKLVCLHGRIALLADMYRGVGFGHAKVATGFLQILTGPEEATTFMDLGKLHRACLWENILIKATIPEAVVAVNPSHQGGGGNDVARGQTATVAGVPRDVLDDISSMTEGKKVADLFAAPGSKRIRNGKAFKYLVSQLPASLTNFNQAILKFLVFKRGNDAAHRKQALKTSKMVAQIMYDHMQWALNTDESIDRTCLYAYGTLMIGFCTVILFDERPITQGSLQVMLLSALEYLGGLHSIIQIGQRYSDAFGKIEPGTELASLNNVHVFSGLKVTLRLLQILSGSKALFESSQTNALATRDKAATLEDDFDPYCFLVRIRLTILPFIRDIWQSDWILSSSTPVTVSRPVVDTLLKIMAADAEVKPEAPTLPASLGLPSISTLLQQNRPPPPSNLIQQLVDMGFSTHASTMALTRYNNNTTLAANFLLTNAGAFAEPAAPVTPAATAEGADAGTAVSTTAESGSSSSATPAESLTGTAPAVSTVNGDDIEMPEVAEGSFTEKKESLPSRWEDKRPELNEMRDTIRPDLGNRALQLADQHDILAADIKSAFGSSIEVVEGLLEETRSILPDAHSANSSKMLVRLRLLSSVILEGSLPLLEHPKLLESMMGIVTDLATTGSSSTNQVGASIEDSHPKWLVPQLHIAEGLFILGETIAHVETLPDDVDAKSTADNSLFKGPLFTSSRKIFFDRCIELLPNESLSKDEFKNVLRLLVFLTRDHSLAVEFAKRGAVWTMVQQFKSTKRVLTGAQTFIAILLRHVIERPEALLALMQQDLKTWFSQPRSKVVDVAHFVKNNKQIALRNPEMFLKAVGEGCSLIESSSGIYHISMKQQNPELTSSDPSASTTETAAPAQSTAMSADPFEANKEESSSKMQVDANLPLFGSDFEPGFDVVEAIVHHLLSELMSIGKNALVVPTVLVNTPPTTPSTKSTAELPTLGATEKTTEPAGSGATTSPSSNISPELSEYAYACLLMQNLTELFGSYMSCKTAFLTTVRKSNCKDNFANVEQPRLALLNFLIHDLVCFSGLADQVPPVKASLKKSFNLSNCAMSVIVALCSDVGPEVDIKGVHPHLTNVRKVMLETISKAIKEATSSTDNVDMRYGRLRLLSELCNRLLTSRPNIIPKGQEDGTLHIAKIMLEKNFAVVLTNALAEIDLNYPDVKLVVTDILKPLEHLTKISIKMGRASDKKKNASSKLQDVLEEASSASSLMDEDDEDDVDEDDSDAPSEGTEETPDIYRNSALGMYGGEMEDVYDEDSGDEDEEDMEGYDEMDGMSEAPTDSGTETGSSEGDESAMEDELIAAEGDWDVEDDDDEDEDDDGEDEEDSSEDEEEEMLYDPDVMDGGAIEGIDIEEMDEMDGGIPIMDEDDEDEDGHPDDDEEEIYDEDDDLGLEVQYDLAPESDNRISNWGWNQAVGGGSIASASATTAPRRRYMLDGDPFLGRNMATANPVIGLSPAMPAFPSAMDGAVPVTGGGIGFNASASGPVHDIIQTIEGLIGGGGAAARILEQLVSGGRAVGGGELRVDVATGPNTGHMLGGFDISSDGVVIQRASPASVEPQPIESRSPDPYSSISDFLPLATSQRWLDEERLTQGRFASQRVADLTNHVINLLLPDARAAAKKAKEEAQEKESSETTVERPSNESETDPFTDRINLNVARLRALVNARQDHQEPSAAAEQSSARADVEMSERSEAADTIQVSASESEEPPSSSSAPTETTPSTTLVNDEVVSSEDHTQPPSTETAREETSSAPSERVVITIHGQEVDITDTGIDLTFLEALPDDMREEVVNQHFRERRPAARMTASAPTEINTEFLEALPPDIRAEVLQQEAVEQSRRDREAAARAAAAASGVRPAQPADIDPASFLASLDPQLRNVVLLEQDDGFLQSLPGEMLAGLEVYRGEDEGEEEEEEEERPRHRRFDGAGLIGARTGAPASSATATKKPPRDAIQLLDKSGIASLVRLLFFPEVSRKTIVPRVLVNLCENSKTRAELLNLLLTVVQEGTGDLSAVDKSFSQMTLRAGKAVSTPKATPRKKGVPDTPGPANLFSHLSAESVPTFIAQRCFEALSQIVVSIERASLFFLTEHDVLVGLKRATVKKGKGKEKEKQFPQTKYPLVILLGLLDRPTLLRNSSMMDSLTALLVTITRPLTTLPSPTSRAEGFQDGFSGLSASVGSIVSSIAVPAAVPSIASTAPTAPNVPTTPAATATGSSTENGASEMPASAPEDPVLSRPPQVPNNVLRLVVNVLTVGDCSSNTFKSALTLIHHLSFIPDAKDVITAELRSQAQEFGNILQVDLNDLADALNAEGEAHRAATIAKFTPASSSQAKLLRVLKTLEHVFTTKPPAASSTVPPNTAPESTSASVSASQVNRGGLTLSFRSPNSSSTDASNAEVLPASKPATDEEQVRAIYNSFSFASLWQKLSNCLAIVEEKPELVDVATVLLPVVESLMVVCKYAGQKPNGERAATGPLSPRSPSDTADSASDDVFLKFTDAHRKILNVIVRNNPALMSGSFALLVENPKVLEFDNKRSYFTQQLRRRPHRDHGGTLQVSVRRDHVFEDSFSKFQRWSADQIKFGKLSCKFWDEEGVDAGGVAREWFSVLAKSIFNPDFALFEPSSSGALTYQFNRLSSVNPDHLAFFRFVGVVLAKAVQDGRLLDAHFVRSVYRQLLGAKNMGLQDLEIVDPSYHTSLKWMAENSIEDILELSFAVESDAFGVQQVHDLIPDGRNVPVTDENKMDYIQRIVNFRLADSVKDQSKAFIDGFTSIIPQSLLQIYDAGELELLISGLPTIDVDELKNSVQLHNWRNSDAEIQWLWRAIRSFSQAERASFLQFTTGSARVPLGGFSQLVGSNGVQPVQVHRAHGDPDRIPTSHTCFNQLDLGSYSSYDALRDKLLLAITEGATGFGFA
ncbi:E3 ubiquitin-protein ligase/Putative upstream regulatory element binding protein [Phaffia rhodozyma]|uniref:HECT-type E3 ubiquitin transferase n=1 Tax=Phaffia rhodozyma TaxID=264483 RepID=A0A0F7SKR7_PHARH|nr:E3 ubiquitin-protein ligase/Putative upstream regulatory element binding protein [Phaffia rhodozyma]